MIFNPQASKKTARASIFLWVHIENQAADITQKFAADILELVMIAVEVFAVHKDHPGEAHRVVLNLKKLCDSAHETLLQTLALGEIVAAVYGFPKIQSSKKIVIFFRNIAKQVIALKILQICFN